MSGLPALDHVIGAPHTDSGSRRQQAYYAIREWIVTLELAPRSVVDERTLAERLRTGRTPVREALQQLAQEKLVEVYPRRGMFVTDVDIGDLARITEVRAVLEPRAAELAAHRASDRDRASLNALLNELNIDVEPSALMALDECVHRAVYRATHNDLLEATLVQYYVLAMRIWMVTLEGQHELRGAVAQHRALVEQIIAGDCAAAAEAMHEHVRDFEQSMRAVLTAAPP